MDILSSLRIQCYRKKLGLTGSLARNSLPLRDSSLQDADRPTIQLIALGKMESYLLKKQRCKEENEYRIPNNECSILK